MYVAIDPGVSTGWALFGLLGLVDCGLGDPRSSSHHVVTKTTRDQDVVNEVWIESQVIYPRSKTPPNDIVKLAHDAGRWAGRYDAVGVSVHFVEPSRWKGQVPKDIHHARVWAGLNDDEKELVDTACRKMAPSKRHNVLDAVGIGAWVRKRAIG